MSTPAPVSIDVPSVALELMKIIGQAEGHDRGTEQGTRDYWLTLFGECLRAVTQPASPPVRITSDSIVTS